MRSPPSIRFCPILLQATTRKHRRHLSSHHLAPQLDPSTNGMVLHVVGFAQIAKILNVAMSLGKTPIIRTRFHQILKWKNIVINKQIKINKHPPPPNHAQDKSQENNHSQKQQTDKAMELEAVSCPYTAGWIPHARVVFGDILFILLREAISFSLRH